MSIQKRTWIRPDGSPATAWRVRWREGDKWKSETFSTRQKAKYKDSEVARRRELGTLSLMDAGKETLDEYVRDTWAPTFGAQLASKTMATYSAVYDHHVSLTLGSVQLRKITPEMVARLQSDRLAAGAGPAVVRKAIVVLGGILQRAAESERIASNPVRVVRKAKLPQRSEVVPLAPSTVEAMRRASSPRDAVLLSVLAYCGLRPGEALGLTWGDVGERTIRVRRAVSQGKIKVTKTGANRSVRLLAPLAADLMEWKLRSGRPDDRELVFPAHDGGVWSEPAYQSWRRRAFARAARAAGLDPSPRPYDLRHSYASLLLHEGRSVIEVARQLGHSATMTTTVYGHVIEELAEAPQQSAERTIFAARDGLVAHRLPIASR